MCYIKSIEIDVVELTMNKYRIWFIDSFYVTLGMKIGLLKPKQKERMEQHGPERSVRATHMEIIITTEK